MRYFVQIAGESVTIDIESLPQGGYRVRDGSGHELGAEVLAIRAGALVLTIGGRTVEAQPSDQEVTLAGQRFNAFAQSERDRARAATAGGEARGAKELRAPMPGRIVRVACAPGEQVTQGSPLIVIEAMKMQNELKAKAEARVRSVRVQAGDTVERGALLVELE